MSWWRPQGSAGRSGSEKSAAASPAPGVRPARRDPHCRRRGTFVNAVFALSKRYTLSGPSANRSVRAPVCTPGEGRIARDAPPAANPDGASDGAFEGGGPGAANVPRARGCARIEQQVLWLPTPGAGAAAAARLPATGCLRPVPAVWPVLLPVRRGIRREARKEADRPPPALYLFCVEPAGGL